MWDCVFDVSLCLCFKFQCRGRCRVHNLDCRHVGHRSGRSSPCEGNVDRVGAAATVQDIQRLQSLKAGVSQARIKGVGSSATGERVCTGGQRERLSSRSGGRRCCRACRARATASSQCYGHGGETSTLKCATGVLALPRLHHLGDRIALSGCVHSIKTSEKTCFSGALGQPALRQENVLFCYSYQ